MSCCLMSTNRSQIDVLLKELHRVLKPDGMFAVIIDHLDPDVFVNDVSESGLFVIDSHDEDFFILRRV
jgi:ubiquinone/menaquinone biosynthesis C-methylase UbiE